MSGHRILDIALACGGVVTVDKDGACVWWDGPGGVRKVGVSASEGLTFDAAVANLELALGRRGVDVVRGGGGHGG